MMRLRDRAAPTTSVVAEKQQQNIEAEPATVSKTSRPKKKKKHHRPPAAAAAAKSRSSAKQARSTSKQAAASPCSSSSLSTTAHLVTPPPPPPPPRDLLDYLFSGVKRILNEDRRGDRIDDKAEEYVRKCREFGVRDWVMMSSEAKEVDRRVRIAMSVDVDQRAQGGITIHQAARDVALLIRAEHRRVPSWPYYHGIASLDDGRESILLSLMKAVQTAPRGAAYDVKRFDWTSLPRRSVPNDVIYAPSNHSFSIVPKAAATAADNRTSSVRRLRRRRLAIFSFSELEDESERAETFSRAALALDSLDDDGGDDEEHKSPPRSGSGSGRMVLLLTADLEGIVSMYMAEWPPKGAVDDDDNDAKTEVDVRIQPLPYLYLTSPTSDLVNCLWLILDGFYGE